LAEENVAAAVSYLVLASVLSSAGAMGIDWRVPLLASLAVPALTWSVNRELRVDAVAAHGDVSSSRLPGAFWVAAAMLMCATAAEWCVTAWGATFVDEVVDTSADTAVAAMAGYFAGVVAGRVLGSHLARRHDPQLLFGAALGVTLVGFTVLWPAPTSAQAAVGLTLLGVGLGNLFPMGLSIAIALAPGASAAASGRAVLVTSAAVLLAPLTVGALADAASLKLALGVVPAMAVMAATLLAFVRRARTAAATDRRRLIGR
jgi:fucose permease